MLDALLARRLRVKEREYQTVQTSSTRAFSPSYLCDEAAQRLTGSNCSVGHHNTLTHSQGRVSTNASHYTIAIACAFKHVRDTSVERGVVPHIKSTSDAGSRKKCMDKHKQRGTSTALHICRLTTAREGGRRGDVI